MVPSDSDRQGYLNPQPCQRSSYWGETKKKNQAPSCRQTSENTSNLKISSRGAPLLPKNSLSNLQKGSGPKPQELLWCRARARWAPATRTNQARQASCFHRVCTYLRKYLEQESSDGPGERRILQRTHMFRVNAEKRILFLPYRSGLERQRRLKAKQHKLLPKSPLR